MSFVPFLFYAAIYDSIQYLLQSKLRDLSNLSMLFNNFMQ